METEAAKVPGLSKSRIETLTDGVFAIAMTLLVFGIKIPEVPKSSAATELPQALLALKSQILTYALSFVMLGVYWVGHHNQFHYIKRSDRVLLWINVAFLMTITFIPFSAALLGRYPSERLSIEVYAGNLIVVGLLLYVNWWYAVGPGRLVDAGIPDAVIRLAKQRTLLAPLIFLIAIAVSFFDTRLSVAIFLVVPLFYILPGRIDIHWSRRSKHKPTSEREDLNRGE